MSKKWLLTLSGSLLAAMLVTGCADDGDPAPPADTNQEDPTENNGTQETDEPNDEMLNNEEGEEGNLLDEDNGTGNGTNGGNQEGNNENGTNGGNQEGINGLDGENQEDEENQ